MKRRSAKETKKIISRGIQLLCFLLLMLVTFCVIFSQNDIEAIYTAIKTLHPLALVLTASCAVFYVCAEGFMIWYLLRAIGRKPRLSQCFGYSFIGFFFSGITPSATGGQPAQLVVMKKKRHLSGRCHSYPDDRCPAVQAGSGPDRYRIGLFLEGRDKYLFRQLYLFILSRSVPESADSRFASACHVSWGMDGKTSSFCRKNRYPAPPLQALGTEKSGHSPHCYRLSKHFPLFSFP